MPSFFGAETIEDAHSDCAGPKVLSSSNLVVYVFSSLRAFGPARIGSKRNGSVTGSANSIRCLAVLILPRRSSNMNSDFDNML